MKIYERLAELVEKRQKFILVGLEKCKEVEDMDYYLHMIFSNAINIHNRGVRTHTNLFEIEFLGGGEVLMTLAHTSDADQPLAYILLSLRPPDYSAARITPSGVWARHPTADLLTSILQEEVPDETTQEAG